jgi:hypothetical protein
MQMSAQRPRRGDVVDHDPSDDLFGEPRETLPAYLRRPRHVKTAPASRDRELFATDPTSQTIDLTDPPPAGPDGSDRRAGDRDEPAPDHPFLGDLLEPLEKRIVELDGRVDALPDRLQDSVHAALAPLVSRLDRIEQALAAARPEPGDLPAFEAALAQLAGIGPARIQALAARFVDLHRLAEASLPEVTELPGIGPDLAEQVIAAAWAATR